MNLLCTIRLPRSAIAALITRVVDVVKISASKSFAFLILRGGQRARANNAAFAVVARRRMDIWAARFYKGYERADDE